jgi:hypothetical protein
MENGFDIIGDIHGHADALINLLAHLGYQPSQDGYRHPSRRVIFLGDFIDRGEHLRQHKKLLYIVMPMVDNGYALAVMGNHEFNALAFHTLHEDQPLRRHTHRNISQHQAFLNEYSHKPRLKSDVLAFFYRLPLWLEMDGLRIVHACWHDRQIAAVKHRMPNNRLTKALLIEASTKGTTAYKAIETLLKGVEIKLAKGITFKDKDGHERDAARVQWWNRHAQRLGEITLPVGIAIGDAADLPLPDFIPIYGKDQRPCFIGHYWLQGNPTPLTHNVACLDYSVAKNGKLVAYRWSGEKTLRKDNFTYV